MDYKIVVTKDAEEDLIRCISKEQKSLSRDKK